VSTTLCSQRIPNLGACNCGPVREALWASRNEPEHHHEARSGGPG